MSSGKKVIYQIFSVPECFDCLKFEVHQLTNNNIFIKKNYLDFFNINEIIPTQKLSKSEVRSHVQKYQRLYKNKTK